MFPIKNIASVFEVEPLLNADDMNQIQEWAQIAAGEQPWVKEGVGVQFAPIACRRIAENVCIKMESEVQAGDGGANDAIEWLNAQYQEVIAGLIPTVETACGVGSFIFRPYVVNDGITVEIAPAGSYLPLRYDIAGVLESVIYMQQEKIGDKYYTLYSWHDWDDGAYMVQNVVYKSSSPDQFGSQVELTDVQMWAHLEPEVTYRTERPWFVEVVTNNGVPIFYNGIGVLQDADDRVEMIRQEFKRKRARLGLDRDMLERDEYGRLRDNDPDFYMQFDNPTGEHMGATVFAPAYQYEPLRKFLDDAKRDFEDVTGLSNGTLSDPQTVDRTATEVELGRQPFYVTVESYRRDIQNGLDALVDVMAEIASYFSLAPAVEYVVTYHWSDNILITEREREAIFMQRVELLRKLVADGAYDVARLAAFVREFSDYDHLIPEELVEEMRAALPQPVQTEY